MRLDHIAHRVKDKELAADFFEMELGYRVVDRFNLKFDDGSTTECIAMCSSEGVFFHGAPPSKYSGTYYAGPKVEPCDKCGESKMVPVTYYNHWQTAEYHMAPEYFVSDGGPDSIVGQWVAERGGVGGIHHLAYEVHNVGEVMLAWKKRGVEFLSDKPLVCEDGSLVQIFTKPHPATGVVYELIERRGDKGFCRESVQALMESTQDD